MKTFTTLIKREYWEHPALWVVPALFAALMVLGHLFGIYSMWRFGVDPEELRWGIEQVTSMDPADRFAFMQGMLIGLAVPFGVFLGFLMFFYALDSLYADRRDRSILFWKSMPVSDVETVLSKLVMALVGVPATRGPDRVPPGQHPAGYRRRAVGGRGWLVPRVEPVAVADGLEQARVGAGRLVATGPAGHRLCLPRPGRARPRSCGRRYRLP